MISETQRRELTRLAARMGILSSYRDGFGVRQVASSDALVAVLEAMGVLSSGAADSAKALRRITGENRSRLMEPVGVVWDAGPGRVLMSRDFTAGAVVCNLIMEDGTEKGFKTSAAELPVVHPGESREAVRAIALPAGIPYGYHRLYVKAAGSRAESLIISAPRQAWKRTDPVWGLFLPLYALRTGRNWGAGDFTDLQVLGDWAGRKGAGLLGVLPLEAAFLSEPFEPAPYSPASRLFLNEMYVDPTAAPEFAANPRARRLAASPGFARRLSDLRAGDLVDYREVMAAKRRVLEILSQGLFEGAGPRRRQFNSFLRSRPALPAYARFRAECDLRANEWQQWPEPQRSGRISPGAADGTAARYYMYTQWLAHEQLQSLTGAADKPGLYLDMPLGVHSASFDTWFERDYFVSGVSAGAPPDPVYTSGQVWGLPPLNPSSIRASGYRYPLACLRHLMGYADALRIDHVMGLHRLFWVPQGFAASQGVYVRYAPREMYALLALESHRTRTLVMGEDLGTVPGYVRDAMHLHGLQRTYTLQYELLGGGKAPLRPPPPDSLASVNNHDMPPFAGFWAGDDIVRERKAGRLKPLQVESWREIRVSIRKMLLKTLEDAGVLGTGRATTRRVVRAAYEWLARPRPSALMVNLEDLWLERRPQNVPGMTADSYPSWRRKAARRLEEFEDVPGLDATLRAIDQSIRGPASDANNGPPPDPDPAQFTG